MSTNSPDTFLVALHIQTGDSSSNSDSSPPVKLSSTLPQLVFTRSLFIFFFFWFARLAGSQFPEIEPMTPAVEAQGTNL